MKIIYRKDILVKFGDTDPQGILYFARAFQFAHECLEEFWSQNSLGWSYWFQNPEWAVPLRHASCDFMLPLRAGHNYQATLTVVNVGESSVEFACEFSDLKNSHTVFARISTVHVFVDKTKFEKISLPNPIREILT